jgi:hypothetical protein
MADTIAFDLDRSKRVAYLPVMRRQKGMADFPQAPAVVDDEWDEFCSHFVGKRLVLQRFVCSYCVAAPPVWRVLPRERRTSGRFSDSLHDEGSITGAKTASWDMRAIVFRMALW